MIHLTKVTAPYLIRKRGIFYLHKRIPKDLVGHYGMNFIRKSLKTRDRVAAIRLSSSIVASLEKEWMDIRFNIPDDVSTFEFLKGERNSEPLLSIACQNYLQMKGRLDDKRFHRHTTRVVGEVIELAGDKLLSAYSRADAVAFRDKLLARKVSSATVKRNFECIRAVWNYSAREYGLNINNPFANMNYGSGAEPVKRKPVPIESIRLVQNECMKADDEIRWLIALISDTGMRLAEAAGVHKDDVHLDEDMPLIPPFRLRNTTTWLEISKEPNGNQMSAKSLFQFNDFYLRGSTIQKVNQFNLRLCVSPQSPLAHFDSPIYPNPINRYRGVPP